MTNLKTALLSGLAVNLVVAGLVPTARSQTVTPLAPGTGITVSLPGVAATVPTKGETQQLNVSKGQRTALSVGNSVSVGTAAQFTSSVGTISVARSVLEPTSVFLKSSIGDNNDQVTKIHIENITANSNLGTINSEGGSDMEVTDGSKFASGKADIIGMVSSSEVIVDVSKGGKAEYFAASNPQVKHIEDPFYRDLLVDSDGKPILDADGKLQYTGNIHTKDASGNLIDPDSAAAETGTPMMKGTEGDDDYWASVNACTPTANNGCIYEEADILKTGNANASSTYQTSTNIDINSNAFTNVFGQAF